MRVIEFSFAVAFILIGHVAVGLSVIQAICYASIALGLLLLASRRRHRSAFRASLVGGDVVRSFKIPSGVFHNWTPYSCFRCRVCYDAVVMTENGNEIEFDVLVEGTFFSPLWDYPPKNRRDRG